MAVTNAGIDYPIEHNCEILKINSPNARGTSEVGIFGNPHVVVAKRTDERRWAIVALTRRKGNFEHNERRLGIRWFHKNNGHPVSRIYAVWFILPQEFHSCILQELKVEDLISERRQELLLKFLGEEVGDPLTDGEALKKDWKAA